MGNPRPRPQRLANKLLAIREGLGLSQSQMLTRLGLEDTMHYGRISQYENDEREPTLMTLLAYAHASWGTSRRHRQRRPGPPCQTARQRQLPGPPPTNPPAGSRTPFVFQLI